MTVKRKLFLGVVLIGLLALAYGNVRLHQIAEHRSERVLRYARMVDTSAEHSQVQVHHYYNTYGIFVDRETGLRFRDDIGDSLYRQFAEGGNKPIEVSWPYSIDKREQTSKGVVYSSMAVVGWVIFVVGLLVLCTMISPSKEETR